MTTPRGARLASGRDGSLPNSSRRDDLMGMAASPTVWTAEMVRALPADGNRYEDVDGELLVTPADIELDSYGLVQPDVFVKGFVDGRPALGWNQGAPLLLFVEVISPGTARDDRIRKRLRFQRAGIPEYWIVDMDSRTVERWRPSDQRPEILSETLSWQPSLEHPPL